MTMRGASIDAEIRRQIVPRISYINAPFVSEDS
jgi:hypothetical protein